MAELAHRIAPHDELVRRAFAAGCSGERMPDFGYLTGFSRMQAEAINAAYDEGRRSWHAQRTRTKP